MIEYKKVDKRHVRQEIKNLERFIIATEEYQKKLKNNSYFKYSPGSELGDQLKECKTDLRNYQEQLTCKHENTEKKESESYHNGDISTKIICTKCKFLLAFY